MICLYLYIFFLMRINATYMHMYKYRFTYTSGHTYIHTYAYAYASMCFNTRICDASHMCFFYECHFHNFLAQHSAGMRHPSISFSWNDRPLHDDVHYIYWRWPVVSGIFAASGKTYKKSVYIHMYVNMCIYIWISVSTYIRYMHTHTYVYAYVCIFCSIWIFTMDNG